MKTYFITTNDKDSNAGGAFYVEADTAGDAIVKLQKYWDAKHKQYSIYSLESLVATIIK